MRWFSVLLVLALAACAEPPPTPGVTVERLPSGDWQATWFAAEPIQSLRFVRPANFLRERDWRIVTPGYALGRDGNAQVLNLVDDGTPSAELVIEFPVNTDFMPRDYELFNLFSDGSAAVFTGHFFAVVNGVGEPLTEVEIAAPPGERVVLDPQPSPYGTYAYVGNIKPVEHERVVAIIDPGLPKWLATTLAVKVPELFEVYETRTGQVLEHRPLVLFSFVPGAGSDINGGALGNLVQLRATGDTWHDDNPWAVRQALRLIAHEAAHLWNNELARFRPGSPPWLHEGGAEAFADGALFALGIIDDGAFTASMERAVNQCLNGRHQGAHYPCGQLAAWWSETAVKAVDASADIFTIWGALATRAQNGDGYYDEDGYFSIVADLGMHADDVALLRRFVEQPRASAAALQTGMARYGVAIVADDAAADTATVMRASAAVVFELLSEDCRGGQFTLHRYTDYLELGPMDGCEVATEGLRIDRFGPNRVDAPAFAAARYAVAKCENHQTVDVGGLPFRCPSAPLPTYSNWRIVL